MGMIRWWPARGADGRHPLLSSVEMLLAALDVAPAVLLITDETGEIVYRNQAANEMARQAVATQGERALAPLRDTLKRHIREARTLPYVRTTSVEVDGELVHGSSTLARFPGGYVVTWQDTTTQVRTAAVVKELTRELSAASTQLTEAGEGLVATAGQAADRAEAVSQGSAEMTESIKEISERVTNAASSTDTAVSSARDAARSMEQLQESSRQIGSITQIIEMVQGIQAESTQVAEGISGIVGFIDTVAEQQTMIAGAVEEQTATSAEMSSGMRSVAASVSASASAAQTVLGAAASLREQAARLSEVTIPAPPA